MRPKLKLPWTKTEKWFETIALIGLWGPILLLGYYWNNLPDSIPQHYNFAGEVDAWGDKSTLLLLIGINAILWLGLTILSRYPHIYNYLTEITEQNAPRQYQLARQLIIFVKAVVTLLFFGITWHIIMTALGHTYPLWPIIGLPVTAIFASLPVYLVRAGQNGQ